METINIKNPLTLFTSSLKIEGTNLIVEAEEVEIVEEPEVELGNLIYAQSSYWYSTTINRQFEIGMTWQEFINSDYNKIQKTSINDIGDYIEGQFIIQNEEVRFYGRDYDHYNGWSPDYKTLDVLNRQGGIVRPTNFVENNSTYYSQVPGSGGGSN